MQSSSSGFSMPPLSLNRTKPLPLASSSAIPATTPPATTPPATASTTDAIIPAASNIPSSITSYGDVWTTLSKEQPHSPLKSLVRLWWHIVILFEHVELQPTTSKSHLAQLVEFLLSLDTKILTAFCSDLSILIHYDMRVTTNELHNLSTSPSLSVFSSDEVTKRVPYAHIRFLHTLYKDVCQDTQAIVPRASIRALYNTTVPFNKFSTYHGIITHWLPDLLQRCFLSYFPEQRIPCFSSSNALPSRIELPRNHVLASLLGCSWSPFVATGFDLLTELAGLGSNCNNRFPPSNKPTANITPKLWKRYDLYCKSAEFLRYGARFLLFYAAAATVLHYQEDDETDKHLALKFVYYSTPTSDHHHPRVSLVFTETHHGHMAGYVMLVVHLAMLPARLSASMIYLDESMTIADVAAASATTSSSYSFCPEGFGCMEFWVGAVSPEDSLCRLPPSSSSSTSSLPSSSSSFPRIADLARRLFSTRRKPSGTQQESPARQLPVVYATTWSFQHFYKTGKQPVWNRMQHSKILSATQVWKPYCASPIQLIDMVDPSACPTTMCSSSFPDECWGVCEFGNGTDRQCGQQSGTSRLPSPWHNHPLLPRIWQFVISSLVLPPAFVNPRINFYCAEHVFLDSLGAAGSPTRTRSQLLTKTQWYECMCHHAICTPSDAFCPICQNTLPARLLRMFCGHFIHANCLLEYVRSSHTVTSEPSCPLCKGSVMPLDQDCLVDCSHVFPPTWEDSEFENTL